MLEPLNASHVHLDTLPMLPEPAVQPAQLDFHPWKEENVLFVFQVLLLNLEASASAALPV